MSLSNPPIDVALCTVSIAAATLSPVFDKMSKIGKVSKTAAMVKSRKAAFKPRRGFKPLVAPGAYAVQLSKEGVRRQLPGYQIVPGQMVWMPYASVIKVTHKDRHQGASDGVEVIAGKGRGGRPGRKAWNHPAIIVKCEGEKVYIVAVSTASTLDECC